MQPPWRRMRASLSCFWRGRRRVLARRVVCEARLVVANFVQSFCGEVRRCVSVNPRLSFESSFHPDRREMTDAERQQAKRILDVWESELHGSGGPFLLGELSLADLAFVPTMLRLTSHVLELFATQELADARMKQLAREDTQRFRQPAGQVVSQSAFTVASRTRLAGLADRCPRADANAIARPVRRASSGPRLSAMSPAARYVRASTASKLQRR